MKAEKVRELDSNELKTQLDGAGEQMFRLKFQLNMGQNEGVKKYRELRKDRARIMTIMREREMNPAANPEPAPAAKKTKKGKK